MSSSSASNRIGGKDLINIGIFTAIIVVVMFVVMPIGFIPVLLPLYCVFMPLLAGIPFMLFLTKVKKFGMILIMGILFGIVLMFTGMGWYALPITVVSSLIAELLVKKGGYKNKTLGVAAHGIFSVWVFGSFIPLIFMADEYWAQNADFGAEYIEQMKNIFQLWTAPALIICCIVFGVIGALLGTKIMKKHFVKAGIV